MRSNLLRLEKEKQRIKEVQTQLMTNYREMCTMLIGYQFKMRDENAYEVKGRALR